MIAELREIGDQLAELLDAQFSVAILLVDRDLRITDCNTGFLRMFSRVDKPLGAPMADFLTAGGDGVQFSAGKQEFACNPKSGVHGVLVAHRLPCRDGLLLWCERLLNTNNRVVEQMSFLNNELIAIQRDLDRKNHHLCLIQHELQGKILQLQGKNDEVEQFIYAVSHDLRCPLVTLKSFLGFLENDLAGHDKGKVSRDLAYIHGAADRMKLMLDELLEMSRIGQVDTQPVTVSLRELILEVLETMAGVTSKRKVDIHLPDTDLLVFGDPMRLGQIWQNLLENAIKYSQERSIARIELGWRQECGETVFWVRDSGIGIASQYQAKVFGIFEKLDPASTGVGLGLSTVKRIVEKYGGRIWVESEGEGQGSCFYFTLPKAMNDCPAHPADSAQTRRPFRDLRTAERPGLSVRTHD